MELAPTALASNSSVASTTWRMSLDTKVCMNPAKNSPLSLCLSRPFSATKNRHSRDDLKGKRKEEKE